MNELQIEKAIRALQTKEQVSKFAYDNNVDPQEAYCTWDNYQGQRASSVLRTFCGFLGKAIASCDDWIKKYESHPVDDKEEKISKHNYVAVQRLGYINCMEQLKVYKAMYDREHIHETETKPGDGESTKG